MIDQPAYAQLLIGWTLLLLTWQKKIEALLSALAQADLSESYDKDSIEIRRTLATATAVVVEYCVRDFLGGYSKQEVEKAHNYNSPDSDDVYSAWDDFLNRIIYGDLLDIIFTKSAAINQLTDHKLLVQATHEYVLVI